MKDLVVLRLRSLRGKYWLVPAAFAAAGAVAALLAVALDRATGADWLDGVRWLRTSQPDGARTMLSTIAVSMLVVAGVTFSVTIAALATTASALGPRSMASFMHERGNQVTLGVFLAAFVYCLIVLRSIDGGAGGARAFVPELAVAGGVLTALAGVGAMVRFVHHVPRSLHATAVLARLGRELGRKVDELYPERMADPVASAPSAPALRGDRMTAVVRPRASGYVQHVDVASLLARASEGDLVVELVAQAGDFVTPLSILARVTLRPGADEDALDPVRDAIEVGEGRSPRQDLLCLADRLVEVAARALSPAVNDVYTALSAIDWLGSALLALTCRRTPDAAHRDAEGRVRVVTQPRAFEEVVAEVVGRLRPYAARDANAALHLMTVLTGVTDHTRDPARQAALSAEAAALLSAARKSLTDPAALSELERTHAELVSKLDTRFWSLARTVPR